MLATRRAVLLGCAASIMGRSARAQPSGLLAAATQEGTVSWYNGYIGDTVAQDMLARFERSHPGVKVQALRSTSQVAYQRLLQDQKAGLRNCDVYSSSDISHFDALSRQHRLMAYTPANAARINPAFRALYEDGAYYPALISMMALGYNTARVPEADAPRNWPDLLLPRWKNQAAMGHPGFSGYAGTWALLMQQMYGDGFIPALARNNPLIGRSSNDSVTQLVSGERIVAAVPAYVAIEAARRGNPIRVVYPTDGALLMVSPAGIMADAPHPNAAKLFMEWLLGPENSALLVAQGAEPINTDVPPAPGQPPIDTIRTRRPALREIVDGIPAVAETWRDAFGN